MKTIKKKNISLKKKYHPCSVYYIVIEMSHEPVHELRICVRSWAPSCLLVLYSSLFLTWSILEYLHSFTYLIPSNTAILNKSERQNKKAR